MLKGTSLGKKTKIKNILKAHLRQHIICEHELKVISLS